MNFAVPADAYDSYMGRHSRRLAPLFADFADIGPGRRVLDVGCGPGALTAELARRVRAQRVAAVDPSPGFALACGQRVLAADVREGPAEQLPWPPGSFDASLAQLVISFVSDADSAVAEMRRVVRAGGTVAACTWDHGGEMWIVRMFWEAAVALDPTVPTESRVQRYTDRASLEELWLRAGLEGVQTAPLVIEGEFTDFDDYWQPFLTGTGPAGAYCVSLDGERQAALRAECFRRLGEPSGPFTLSARAWAVRGVA